MAANDVDVAKMKIRATRTTAMGFGSIRLRTTPPERIIREKTVDLYQTLFFGLLWFGLAY